MLVLQKTTVQVAAGLPRGSSVLRLAASSLFFCSLCDVMSLVGCTVHPLVRLCFCKNNKRRIIIMEVPFGYIALG